VSIICQKYNNIRVIGGNFAWFVLFFFVFLYFLTTTPLITVS